MAIQEYPYRRVKHNDIEDAVCFWQNTLNLRDWEIVVDTSPTAPKCFSPDEDASMGKVKVFSNYLKAVIWIPIKSNQYQNSNALEAVAHEMIHILTMGVADCAKDSDESLAYRLEPILFEYFCFKTKKRIPPKKSD